MKIIAVSDLHRASDDKVDNFGLEQEKRFIDFIKQEVIKANIFLILGDKEELWQGDGWTEAGRLKLIYKRYWRSEKVLNWLKEKGIKVITLPGNHDWYLKYKYKLPERFIAAVGNWNLLFIHGHQFDEQYKTKTSSTVGRIATEFWGWGETIFGKQVLAKILPRIENFFEKKNFEKKESAKNLNDSFYIHKAINLAKTQNCSGIIIGHTHKPKIEKVGDILYANTGTWIDDRRDYIVIDTKKRSVELKTWN